MAGWLGTAARTSLLVGLALLAALTAARAASPPPAAALVWAAEHGTPAQVEAVLAAGTPVDAADYRGMTALSVAAAAGRTDVIKVLIAHGANVRIPEGGGRIASELAPDGAVVDAARLLIAQEAELKAGGLPGLQSSADGDTPAGVDLAAAERPDLDRAAFAAWAGRWALRLLVMAVLWIPAAMLAVAAHEFGHALCARAVSIFIDGIVIGAGPVLWAWDWREARVEIRLWPIAGYVWCHRSGLYGCGAWALMVAGGALGNAAALASLALLALAGRQLLPLHREAVTYALAAPIAWQLFMLLAALVPTRITIRGTPTKTDIWALWDTLRAPRQATAEAVERYRDLLRPYLPSPDAAPARLRAMPFVLQWIARWHPSSEGPVRDWCERALDPLIDAGVLTTAEAMLVLDSRTTSGLQQDGLYSLAQMDDWSKRLLALGPAVAAAIETRASVLIQLGRHAEGKAMLDRLDPPENNLVGFLRRLFLAQAEHGLDHGDAARAALADARRVAATLGAAAAGWESLTARLAGRIEGAATPVATLAPAGSAS